MSGTIEVVSEEELSITLRAFELGVFMTMGNGYTVRRAEQEFAMSFSGAYRLLERVCGSRRVPVTVVNGVYRIMGIDAQDWPY